MMTISEGPILGSLNQPDQKPDTTPQRAWRLSGGIGKTRLAVEYAWRHLRDHSAVLFVPADSPESLHQNLAALAGPLVLDLPEQQVAEQKVREVAVVRWLREHPGWLLILDNLDTEDAAAAAEGLLNRLQSGQVLLTSRLSSWGPHVEAHELDVLTDDAATDFLLARTNPRRRKTADDEGHARTLARELDGLALALEQAAAYVLHHRLSFPDYLEAWEERHARVLGWSDERLTRYPASVAITWHTSIDRLSDPTRRLLDRLAWLAPDPIPESLLDTPVPGDDDASDLHEALSELAAYSLVTRSGDAPVFTVHRLVQDVTRHWRDSNAVPQALLDALTWLDHAFRGNSQDAESWPTLEPLALHVETLVWRANDAGVAYPTAGLMNRLGRLFMNLTRFEEAERLARRGLSTEEATVGPDHPNIALHLNDLAALLYETGRLKEAEPLMRKALTLDQRALGADHPAVAKDLNNLGLLLKATSRYEEAEPLLRRALEIDQAVPDPDYSLVALRLSNLAQLLQETDRKEEAEPLIRRALGLDLACFGPDHPFVARDLHNLGQLFQTTNRLDEAEPLLRQALAIDEARLGPEHPAVASHLNNLGHLLTQTGKLEEAEILLQRAVRIDERCFGPNHPSVADPLNNLGALLVEKNRLSEAEQHLRRAVCILVDFDKRTGHEHPRVILVLTNYAHVLGKLDKDQDEIMKTLRSLIAARRGGD
jgi:tetratricopeptide (TPR) repeat protein